MTEEKKPIGCYYRRASYETRENLKDFAMSAVTLGAVLRTKEPYLDRAYIERGETIREVFWFFEPSTRDGVHKLVDLWKWWNDDAWRIRNPDHPLTICWQLCDNLRRATAYVQTCPEKVMIIRGDRHLILPRKADPETKKKAFEALEKKPT